LQIIPTRRRQPDARDKILRVNEGATMADEKRQQDETQGQSGGSSSGSSSPGGGAAGQSGDPGRTPGKAEGDEQTVDESLRRQEGGQ
jgi:hypothetical protein